MQRRQKQIWSLQSFRSCRSAWIDVSFGLCDLYSCTSYARVSPEWLPFYASETDACVSADRRIEGSVLVMLIEVGEPYNRPNDSISAKGRNYSFGKIHVSVDPFSEREMLWVTVGCRSYAHTHTHTPLPKITKTYHTVLCGKTCWIPNFHLEVILRGKKANYIQVMYKSKLSYKSRHTYCQVQHGGINY